jgi:hypothetical protein
MCVIAINMNILSEFGMWKMEISVLVHLMEDSHLTNPPYNCTLMIPEEH